MFGRHATASLASTHWLLDSTWVDLVWNLLEVLLVVVAQSLILSVPRIGPHIVASPAPVLGSGAV